MRFLPAAFWLVLACLAAAMARAQVPPTSVTPATSKDAVFIVAMSPESLVDGIEADVELTVAYELTSKPEAIVELAANNLRPQSASPFTSQRMTGFFVLVEDGNPDGIRPDYVTKKALPVSA